MRIYCDEDWAEFTAADPDFLSVRGFRVPYVVFENEDDMGVCGPGEFVARLETALGRLWELQRAGS
jgi:hypothetical protein